MNAPNSNAGPGQQPEEADLAERLAVAAQHLLPKQALTQLMGQLAGARAGSLTTAVIKAFIARYGVNMAEAVDPNPGAYASFNDFFTRALKPGVRPLAQADWVCPVDGAISQFGRIDGEHIFQAKGHRYTATALVGGDSALAARFHSGHFATLYLSPKDYHRIHMPCDGQLVHMRHVPGDLFSVNPATARGVPGLFARNERVVCSFDSPRGPIVLVLVGATIVGSMATVWHGLVNPPRPGVIRDWRYASASVEVPAAGASLGTAPIQPAVALRQGAEMGRFLLGSTVVLLFPPGPLRFNPQWAAGGAIRMGELMAQAVQA